MNQEEFSAAANERFESLGNKGTLVAKCFWKLFGEEKLADNLELAAEVASEAIVKFLELVERDYVDNNGKWCKSLRNAMIELLREDDLIVTPRRRQDEGADRIQCETNQEDGGESGDFVTEYQSRRAYAATLKLMQEQKEALELIEWIASNGDELDQKIVDAMLVIIHEEGLDNISHAKIARIVGCHPQTVKSRREQMDAIYLEHSPETLLGWE